jgi:hypothetical protein
VTWTLVSSSRRLGLALVSESYFVALQRKAAWYRRSNGRLVMLECCILRLGACFRLQCALALVSSHLLSEENDNIHRDLEVKGPEIRSSLVSMISKIHLPISSWAVTSSSSSTYDLGCRQRNQKSYMLVWISREIERCTRRLAAISHF